MSKAARSRSLSSNQINTAIRAAEALAPIVNTVWGYYAPNRYVGNIGGYGVRAREPYTGGGRDPQGGAPPPALRTGAAAAVSGNERLGLPRKYPHGIYNRRRRPEDFDLLNRRGPPRRFFTHTPTRIFRGRYDRAQLRNLRKLYGGSPSLLPPLMTGAFPKKSGYHVQSRKRYNMM